MRFFHIIFISLLVFPISSCSHAQNDSLPNMDFMKHGGSIELASGLRDRFSPGTPKEVIHQALVEGADAVYEGKAENPFNESYRTNTHQYSYQQPLHRRFLHDGKYRITLLFDDEGYLLPFQIENENPHQNNKFTTSVKVSGPIGL